MQENLNFSPQTTYPRRKQFLVMYARHTHVNTTEPYDFLRTGGKRQKLCQNNIGGALVKISRLLQMSSLLIDRRKNTDEKCASNWTCKRSAWEELSIIDRFAQECEVASTKSYVRALPDLRDPHVNRLQLQWLNQNWHRNNFLAVKDKANIT